MVDFAFSEEGLKFLQRAIPHYDKFQDRVAELVAEWCQPRVRGGVIELLEIGTGVGNTTRRILEADRRLRVTSLDNTPMMIAQAASNLAQCQERCVLKKADALKFMSKMGSTADIIVSVWTIHGMFPDYRRKVLVEAHRVLRAGGCLLIADKVAYEDQTARMRALMAQIEGFMVSMGRDHPDLAVEWISHYCHDEETTFTRRELTCLLAQLGFYDIEFPYREAMEAIITARKGA